MDAVEANVLAWLTSGEENAPDIVDLPWAVEEIEMGVYLAEHPSVPMRLMVKFSEGFIHLIVPTTIYTSGMSEEEKLSIYQALLELNEAIYMMKFTLNGPEGQIRLRIDLDKETLGKEEFNDALTTMAIGVFAGVSALGIEEEFLEKIMDRIVLMLVDRIEKGASDEELMEFLTRRVGMDELSAKVLLDAVLAALGMEPKNKASGHLYLIFHMSS